MADKRTRVMLANLLKNGELYAAHQKYRTTAARLLKTPAPSSFGTGGSRGSASSDAPALPYDDDAVKAAELLYEGARALLEKGELGGGTDLTLYLLEVWRTRGVPCTDDTRNKVQTLIALVGGTGNWRKSIVDHAVHWTAVVGDETPGGDESLHAYIGQILYKDRDYLGGEHHFIASLTRDSARCLASLLFDWYKSEPSSASPSSSTSSLGRYCARGVLSYLESSSILCARVFLSSFLALATSHDPSLLIERTSLSTWQDPSESDPELVVTRLASLNFLQLALRTCQIGAAEQQVRRPPGQGQGMQTVTPGRTAWTQLLSRYEREAPWLREGEVKESLSYLGQMYFNIKPAQQGGANILGDLMSSLFGGGGGGGGASQAALPGPAGRGRGRGGASSTPKITQAGLD